MRNQKLLAKIDKYPDPDWVHEMVEAGVDGLVVSFPHSSIAWLAETLDHLKRLNERNKHLGLMLEFDFSQGAMVEIEYAKAVGVKWIAIENFKSLMELQAIKKVLGKDVYLIAKVPKDLKEKDVLHIVDGLIVDSQDYRPTHSRKHIFVEARNNSVKPSIAPAHIDGIILENPTPIIMKRVEKILAKGKLITQSQTPSEDRIEQLAHNLINIVSHTDPTAIITSDFAFARALALENPKSKIVLLSNDRRLLASANLVRKIHVHRLKGNVVTSLKEARFAEKGDRFINAMDMNHPEISVMP
jgi:hypothetical protein